MHHRIMLGRDFLFLFEIISDSNANIRGVSKRNRTFSKIDLLICKHFDRKVSQNRCLGGTVVSWLTCWTAIS